MTPGRRFGTPIDESASMVAHRLLSSAMHSNGDSGWPVDSLILSYYDLHGLHLQRLPSTVSCSVIFSNVPGAMSAFNG